MSGWRVIDRPQRDALGEGVTWSVARGSVLWVDILAPALYEYRLADRAVSRWPMPEAIGWIVERDGRDDFIVGLKSGFAELSLDPFRIVPIGNPEARYSTHRMNDGKADAAGRIWAGTKNDAEDAATAALWRLDPDRSWTLADPGYVITNGPAFAATGRTLYHADTLARRIYAFDLAADGTLSAKRVFVSFADDWGYPDGMTVDAEDHLWVVGWGSGQVHRFTPDGHRDRSIALPVSQPTNCVFAGPALDRMFVTSAAIGVDEPSAGALFEVDPGVIGRPSHRFAG